MNKSVTSDIFRSMNEWNDIEMKLHELTWNEVNCTDMGWTNK